MDIGDVLWPIVSVLFMADCRNDDDDHQDLNRWKNIQSHTSTLISFLFFFKFGNSLTDWPSFSCSKYSLQHYVQEAGCFHLVPWLFELNLVPMKNTMKHLQGLLPGHVVHFPGKELPAPWTTIVWPPQFSNANNTSSSDKSSSMIKFIAMVVLILWSCSLLLAA